MGCCGSKEDDRDDQSKKIPRYEKSSVRLGSKSIRSTKSPSLRTERTEKTWMPTLYVAMFNYKAVSNSELNLTKGDILQDETEECDAGPEWVFASKTAGKRGCGYAPRAWLAKKDTFEEEPWYHGTINRRECERILEGLPDGTFMLRCSDVQGGTYALSVSFNNTGNHYRVREIKEPDGRVVYNIGKLNFNTMHDLVKKFQSVPQGVCCRLGTPAPRQEPKRAELSADVQKTWHEIPRNQIRVEKELAKGQYGAVLKGVWKPPEAQPIDVAIKELKAAESPRKLVQEAVFLKALVHAHLVRLYGVVSADEPYWMITEFVKDGSLKSFLAKRAKEGRKFMEPILVNIASQVADGLHYLESKKIVHRDVAARNVLVAEVAGEVDQIDVKISNIGVANLALKEGAKDPKQSLAGFVSKWAAPEAVNNYSFTTASDVWSFGMLLHEIFTHGEEPFKDMEPREVNRMQAREKRFALKRHDEVPEKIYNLMGHCCAWKPQDRITFHDVIDSLERYYDKNTNAYTRFVAASPRKR